MVAKKSTVDGELLRRELEELRRRLEGCRLCVSIAAYALRHQNAELDTDIAMALMRGAADPLHDEVERVARWAARFKVRSRPKVRQEGKKRTNRR